MLGQECGDVFVRGLFHPASISRVVRGPIDRPLDTPGHERVRARCQVPRVCSPAGTRRGAPRGGDDETEAASWGPGSWRLAAVLSGGLAAGPASSAAGGAQRRRAAVDAEQALAERFAPVVALVHQDVECGPGEPYQPSDVDLVLGDQSVALRGPWTEDEVIKVGPTADDLSEGLYGYHLDFPGNPLEAGCDYEEWAGATAAGCPPTTYAHVATEAGRDGRLALQYWFFYPFNDYTNKHEGDWEMIQLVFAAADAAAGARPGTRSRSATASTRASRSPVGTTRSSRSSTARIRSCTPPPAPTPTTSTTRCTSARPASRGSAATTPAARPTTCVPPSQ